MNGISEVSSGSSYASAKMVNLNMNTTSENKDGGASQLTQFTVNNEDSGNSYLKSIRDMKNASDSLEKSAKEAPIASNQQLLNSLVKQCEMMDSISFSARSWNSMMKAYANAKKLSLSDNPKLKDLKRAISELNGAMAALERADKVEKEEDDAHKEGLPIIIKMGGDSASATDMAVASTAAATAVAIAGVDVSI